MPPVSFEDWANTLEFGEYSYWHSRFEARKLCRADKFHYFDGVYFDKEINPDDYSAKVMLGMVSHYFAVRTGTRLESSLDERTYEGDDKYQPTGRKQSHLFALQRKDGQWDLFRDEVNKEKWVEKSQWYYGYEWDRLIDEHVISKTGSSLQKEQVLEIFESNHQYIEKRTAKELADREEQKLAQAERNQRASQAKAFEKSFFN